ncbi:MAG: PaaI family thioesterase [Desulfobacteraceae bacterium]
MRIPSAEPFGLELTAERLRAKDTARPRSSHPAQEPKTEPLSLQGSQQARGGDNVRVKRQEDNTMPNKISAERAAFLAQDYSRGFIKYCQFEGEVMERGCFQSRVEIEDHHRQQDGFIHAGLMATMADHTAGYAAFSTVPGEFRILTIEFKINFLKPAFGDSLVCHSKVIREGNQIIISESEVFDVRGKNKTPVAKALVTLMAVHHEKLLSARQR